MGRVLALASAVLAALTFTQGAWADESMRCDAHIVDENDSIYTLLEHCGEPTRRDGVRWVYDRGDDSFVTVVTVRENDDSIERIEDIPRD